MGEPFPNTASNIVAKYTNNVGKKTYMTCMVLIISYLDDKYYFSNFIFIRARHNNGADGIHNTIQEQRVVFEKLII